VSGDWSASRAPSKRIAAQLRDAIARGDYDERPRLPSAMQLAEAHDVAPATAAKALRRLVDAGLAVSTPGVGTFALAPGDRAELGRRAEPAHPARRPALAAVAVHPGAALDSLPAVAPRAGLPREQADVGVPAAADDGGGQHDLEDGHRVSSRVS
jgi:DNA-binding transcriptional regulator YhcF (GntR family)